MATYLHPGVYIEEIPSGSKPIEGVPTSVAAFVGPAPKGPAGEANLIHKLDDYKNDYGEVASEDDAMGLAIQAFYLNGGKSAYICRLAGSGSGAAETSVDGQGSGGTPTTDPVLLIAATSVGEWGNDVYIRTVKADQDSLTFDLEVGHQDEDGEFVADETFSGLSMREDDSNYALTQVNGNSAYVELSLGDGAVYQDATLTGGELPADAGYFNDNITGPMSLTININGTGAELITIDPSGDIDGLDQDVDGQAVADAIQSAVRNASTSDEFQNFSCDYDEPNDSFVLTSAQDDSAASLEVYRGDLANLLRLDNRHTATFTGNGAALLNTNGYFTGAGLDGDLVIDVDDHGAQTITLVAASLGLQGTDNQDDGDAVALAIQNAVQAIDPQVAAYRDFECSYDSSVPAFTLTSGSASSRTSSVVVSGGSLRAALGLDTGNAVSGRSVEQGTATVIPLQTLGTLDEGVQLTGGSENPPTANDYADFYGNVMRKVRDVSIIVLPGQFWAEDGSGNAIISQTLAHCESTKSRVVIIDPPADLELDQAATVDRMSLPTSTYSVLYYPWVAMANPFYHEETNPNADKTLDVQPSAFAAGMWSKIDGKRGVWKAPAGVETQLLGAAGLAYKVEDAEQDSLNPLGVNCIRKLPSFGSVIWGSRTLSTKADPEWRYVPVRRTAIFIEQSIYQGIQWAVFEPNDHPLWGSLRANIGAFMNGLFRAGAFQGATADEAYFVRCGLGDTMTQGDIDRGQVIVIVGFAPLKPAEFVIVRIQQKVAQQ